MPRPSEVIRGRLARRVGRVRPVRRGIGEDARATERAVDFVGRDVQETKGLLRAGPQTAPILGCRLEQRHRPLHVGGNEVHGTVDGTIHMGLGREVDHRVRARFGKSPAHGFGVSDVDLLDTVVRSVRSRSQGHDMARVGQHVQGHDLLAGRRQPPHHTRADEARPSRHQYAFHASSILCRARLGGRPDLALRPTGRSTAANAKTPTPRATRRALRAPQAWGVPDPCRRAPLLPPGLAIGCRAPDHSTEAPCRDRASSNR